MMRDDAIHRLKNVEVELRAIGVEAVYLYGSVARNEARPESDVDVLVDPVQGVAFGLRQFMASYRVVQAALGDTEVGYNTRRALRPDFSAAIESDLVRVF